MTYTRNGWEQMTDVARGDFIRAHARGAKPVPPDGLMKLFCLSEPGLVLILQGEPWRQEYQEKSQMFEGVTEEMLSKERAENDALMAAEKLLRDHGYIVAFIHDGKDQVVRLLKEYSELAGKDQMAVIDTDTLNGGLAKIDTLTRALCDLEQTATAIRPFVAGRAEAVSFGKAIDRATLALTE